MSSFFLLNRYEWQAKDTLSAFSLRVASADAKVIRMSPMALLLCD
jgi:hypothetical protein